MTWTMAWRRIGVEVVVAGIAVFGWLAVARLYQDDQLIQVDHQRLDAVVNFLQQHGVQPVPQASAPAPETK